LDEDKSTRIVAIYLFLFIVSVYLISSSFPKTYFVDQYSQRYEVTKSIVERFDLSIPEGMGIKGIDGRDYSLYGLGWSAIAIPFYMMGKFVGSEPANLLTVLNPLVGGATVALVFFFGVALGYSRRASIGVAFFYGIGSIAWPLSKQPFDHVLETFFILMTVYSMYIYTSRDKIYYLFSSAIFFGLAMNTRLTSSLVMPALFVMMAYECFNNRLHNSNIMRISKNIIVFLMVLLPFIGMIMWYNFYRFGSPFETGFQLVAIKTGLDFFSATPLFTGLQGLLLSPGKGFFYYSPISILFFPAIVSFYKKNQGLAIAFIFIIVSYLLFLSKNVYWHGDWAWGPRYLLAITPFFIIPIGELLDSKSWIKKKYFIILPVYFVFLLSIIIQVVAVSVHFYNHFNHLAIDHNIQFSIVEEVGGPSIIEPPLEIYFDWNKSPIWAQFVYAKNIGTKISNYRYLELPEDAPFLEKIKAFPSMHLYDFWWVYLYFIFSSYDGFIALFVFLMVTCICGYRIKNLSGRNTF